MLCWWHESVFRGPPGVVVFFCCAGCFFCFGTEEENDGTLVAVGEDGTCELAAAGRRLKVSIEALSDHDRDYARRATTRLTVGRTGKPATGDTAGL